MHEAQTTVDDDGVPINSFVTATYRDADLPPWRSLDISHWQNFAKRLRKNVGPFRYFHCGEYSPDKQRPHYHALIFGLNFTSDRELLKTTDGGHKLYTSKTLDDNWQHGDCYFGDVSYQSASYVAGYCIKKLTGQKGRDYYAIRDPASGKQLVDTVTGEMLSRTPPYATMSRRPGIGHDWYQRYGKTDVVKHDTVIQTNGQEGKPPKYYDQFLSEEKLAQVKAERSRKAKQRSADNTWQRLRAKEICAIAKEKQRA